MNKSNPPSDDWPPIGSFGAIVSFTLTWVMMLSGPGFPFSLVLALVCMASPFVVGFMAWRHYRHRSISTAHRIAYYACLSFFGVVAFLYWIAPFGTPAEP